jgi:hypothetical protein
VLGDLPSDFRFFPPSPKENKLSAVVWPRRLLPNRAVVDSFLRDGPFLPVIGVALPVRLMLEN